MAQELPETQTLRPTEPTRVGSSAAAAPPPEPVLSGAQVGLLILLGSVAYRSLAFWSPNPAEIPETTWFFFGWSRTSPQILLAIGAALLIQRRRYAGVALHDEGSPGHALAPLLLSFALFAWGVHAGASDVIVLSLISALLGGALLLFGTRFARRITLPVLFLAFAIPPPAVAINQIVFPLQLWTASHVTWLLGAGGVAATLEGDVIQLADGVFEVIESCSGLRSIQVLTILAVAWISVLAIPRWHAVTIVAAAPLIAYVVNLARVSSLILEPQSAFSTAHSLQGVVMFLAGIVALGVLDAILRRFWGSWTPPPPAGPGPGSADRRRRAVVLSAFLAVLVGASFLVPTWTPPPPEASPVQLPDRLGRWTASGDRELDVLFFGGANASEHRLRRYDAGGYWVDVFIGHDDRLRRDRSLLSRKNAFPEGGWEPEAEASVALSPGGPVAVSLLARSGASRILTLHWHEGSASTAEEILRASLATDQSVLRRPRGALVVRLSTPVSGKKEGRARAESRLRELAELLGPPLLGEATSPSQGATPGAP